LWWKEKTAGMDAVVREEQVGLRLLWRGFDTAVAGLLNR